MKASSNPKLLISIFIAFGIMFFVGCGKSATEEGIQLNDGEKWKVNAEMTPHITEAEAIFEDYMEKDRTDYLVLADQLKEQNSKLIRSCTMEGESHEELHKWLHPHLGLVADLSKAEDEISSLEQLEKLEASFKLYRQYFE